jgi:site-specific DNA recombinase
VWELDSYEPTGDPDVDTAWRSGLQSRFAALVEERRANTRRLGDLGRPSKATPGDAGLLDALPLSAIDVTRLPEEQQREIYDAFHLEVRYHTRGNEVFLRITIDGRSSTSPGACSNPVFVDGLPGFEFRWPGTSGEPVARSAIVD